MKLIDRKLLNDTTAKATASPRKRMNHNFHEDYADPINRMLNAMEPGTYIQPHKHEDPDKREVFMILSGTLAIILFDHKGNVSGHYILNHEKGVYALEIEPSVWHMVISLEPGTVMYEIKDGPYAPMTDKNFAPWAPKEGSSDCSSYLQTILKTIGR